MPQNRVFGTAPSQAGDVTCLLALWIDTPLGAMLALASHEGLHLLEFVDRRGLEREIATLQRRLRCSMVPGNNSHLERLTTELRDYFRRSMRFTVPIVMMGSEFERSVWRLLQTIPAGTTRSYAQLAKTLHRPNATRAVGRANGKNCLALVIPCHRVIRADGNLCGYGGGIWRKHWLLDHERQGLEETTQRSPRSQQMSR